jgi:hypothetical protein
MSKTMTKPCYARRLAKRQAARDAKKIQELVTAEAMKAVQELPASASVTIGAPIKEGN